MKILQINSVYGVGSTGKIVFDIHKLLQEKGHESYVVYGRGPLVTDKNVVKIGNKLDNYFHAILTRVFDRHGFGSKLVTKKLIKEIKNINPDLIHLHNIHGYYINIEILFNFLKASNIPIVWTFHDCWNFTGHCSHFDYVGCNKWKTKCNHCPQKRIYPKSVFIDNSKNNFIMKKKLFTSLDNITVVTPSFWLGNLVKESFFKAYPLKVIHNGIDLNSFKPTISEFRKNLNIEDKYIILGVAYVWQERKGYNYFLELSQMLFPDEIIVLVGLTDKQKRRLPNNIIGLSKTNSIKELAEIYTSSDVFVNPTLEDNFPTTNIEALACGTPVITFNTGGSIESIDEKTGYIVKKGNIKDLRHTISKLKITPLESNDCICHAAKFNKYLKFNEFISLYEKILKTKLF